MFAKMLSAGAMLALLIATAGVSQANGSNCEVTGQCRPRCCASEAYPMPPCCVRGCSTPARIIR